MKTYIHMALLLGISINAVAEDKLRKEVKGDKQFFVYAFDKAIDSYTHAKHLTTDGQRRLAESYHNIDSNMQSEVAYSKLLNTGGVLQPEDYYKYAMVLKTNGKYEQSNAQMDKFRELKPADLRAKDYAAHKNDLPTWMKNTGKYDVNHMNINTDASDFAVCYYKDKMVFASSRARPKMIKRIDNWTRQPFLDLYVSETNDGQLKTPVRFGKKLNGKWHEGAASFSNDGNYVAFTRSNYQAKGRVVNIEICFSTLKDGKWSKPQAFPMDNNNYSVGHPSLSADGMTMYFTSNMPGGYGGTDIYRTTRNVNGAWGKAENVGDNINTEGDELFPFYEEKSNTLFFTSNGRFGLGGLDVFTASASGSGFTPAANAGAPLNTQYDDFAVLVDSKMSKGYFSSNRAGGSGSDDIYSVNIMSVNTNKKVEGIVKDKDGMVVPAASISLMDDKGNVVSTVTSADDGTYSFVVTPDKNFKVKGKKEHYIDGESPVSTFGTAAVIKADLVLAKEVPVVQQIKPGADLGKIVAFDPDRIYFDYNKSNIRPDAAAELDKIVVVMNQYPDMQVALGAYADCRASASYNQVLSDKRAKASASYIKKRITKPERISGKGYGETKLVNNCNCDGKKAAVCSENEYEKDRRTEFIIVKVNMAASK